MRYRPCPLDLVAVALVGLALAAALSVTSGLPATFGWDQLRDTAQAQTALDGAPLSDQYYRGEWAWYNPLLAWTLAAAGLLSGVPLPLLHVHLGPWLNLLGPVAFYLLGVRLLGRRGALIALSIHLFFVAGTDGLGWAYATYSPWLYSNTFAQGPFFLSALALHVAAERDRWLWQALAGVLMGLTFLAHTGPALILVAVAVALYGGQWRKLLLTGAVSFAVALPFIWSIGKYGFEVVNFYPIRWEWGGALTPDSLGGFLNSHALLIGLALLGCCVASGRLLLTWFAAAALLTLYGTLADAAVIPVFHFWKWLTAAMTLLAGGFLAWFGKQWTTRDLMALLLAV